MPVAPAKESGEKLQITVLTLAMTGGGFALLTLVFLLFLNPGAASDADRLEKEYAKLAALLKDPQTKDLRETAKRSEGQDSATSLGEIVKGALDRFGLKYPTFPQIRPKPIRQGLDELRLKISTEPAKLGPLVQFVGAVLDSKKSIQVESADFKRDTRSKTDEDLWTATAEFVEYVAK